MFKLQNILAIFLLASLTYGLSLRLSHDSATHPYIHDVQKVCQCPADYPYYNGK